MDPSWTRHTSGFPSQCCSVFPSKIGHKSSVIFKVDWIWLTKAGRGKGVGWALCFKFRGSRERAQGAETG